MELCDCMILTLVGCGEAPADCAGECANTGDRLGMGVGYACVFVEGSICALVTSVFLDELL